MRLKVRYRNWVVLVSILATFFGLFTIYSLYRWYRSEFPEVTLLNTHFPHVLYQGPKKPFKIQLKKSPPGSWVRLNQISPVALGAVVVSEDWAFFQHDGIDTKQLKEAIKEDLNKGKFKRGGSTITMQVVKNVFLTNEKTIYRKFKELLLAMELDDKVQKKKILEVYFNIAEWGEGIFGIQNAARFYFKKPASELSAKEGAFLAMLLPSPKRYSQSYRSKQLTRYASRTIQSILGKMVQGGYLSADERAAEDARPLGFEEREDPVPPVESEEVEETLELESGEEPELDVEG
jgi:monofunctional glycosyltransferase